MKRSKKTFNNRKNEKLTSMMKDKIIKELVGLRAKVYPYKQIRKKKCLGY